MVCLTGPELTNGEVMRDHSAAATPTDCQGASRLRRYAAWTASASGISSVGTSHSSGTRQDHR